MDFFITFSLAFILSLFPALSLSSSDLTDKEALLSFKGGLLDDPSISALSSWNDSSSVCQWRGILCDKSRRVSSLDLRGLGLVGSISPYLGNLSSLQFLYLQDNHFAGALPGELGGLTRLEILNASSNLIGGVLPTNISRCTDLTTLDLAVNTISGKIPSELQQLQKLQILNLSQNQFHGLLPPSIGNLSSSLRTLNLGTNNLSGSIPSELGRLHSLQVLHININNFTGTVPASLYNLSSLVTFDLASNDLHGQIPGDVGIRLPNMLTFHFCINKFTGQYPPSLHNLTKMQSLRMSHNFLNGTIPPGLGALHDLVMYNIGFNLLVSNGLDFITLLTNSSKLQFLAVDANLLEGAIPESIGNLSTSLSKLYLGENRIYGRIPTSIASLRNLTLLNMNHNSIDGEIPYEIGQLKQLRFLALADNKLSGEIPASLGELTLLTELDLYENKLEGTIPSTLGELQNMLSLDLSSNRLNGSVPRELFTLSSLSALLNLSKNALSGPLPEEIGHLDNIAAIDFSSNLFSGNIPISIQTCKILQTLSMSNNLFSGQIPDTIGNLKGLMSLDLSSNQLSGPIPQSIAELQSLQFLNLSFNKLEGQVPTVGIFQNLSHVHLEGNAKLCLSSSCNNSRSAHSSKVIAMIVPASVFSLLAIVLLVFTINRKRNARKVLAKINSIVGEHRMISYQELLSATENFDSSNLIGTGSFGSVYKGVLRDGMAVAVKVLNLRITGASKSFLAECKALRNVRHRNLVKLVTLCSSIDFANNEFQALVYELMPNGSLEDWIRGRRCHRDGRRLNTMERLAIAADVAGSLDYLHNDCEIQVVHCDLKPSNVVLASDMTAKVTDFGLAMLLVENGAGEYSSTTSTQALKGSIGYIPPEYGFGGRPSTKGDVYSYGVMLLELLTGKSPTDEDFAGDLSLGKWVRDAFPERVMEVLEAELLTTSAIPSYDRSEIISQEKQAQCLASMVEVGLSCANQSPDARPNIREVLHKLSSISQALMKQNK